MEGESRGDIVVVPIFDGNIESIFVDEMNGTLVYFVWGGVIVGKWLCSIVTIFLRDMLGCNVGVDVVGSLVVSIVRENVVIYFQLSPLNNKIIKYDINWICDVLTAETFHESQKICQLY